MANCREMEFCRIKDDWGFKYGTELDKGLASMPGGYPGGKLEEILDDESLNDEISDGGRGRIGTDPY